MSAYRLNAGTWRTRQRVWSRAPATAGRAPAALRVACGRAAACGSCQSVPRWGKMSSLVAGFASAAPQNEVRRRVARHARVRRCAAALLHSPFALSHPVALQTLRASAMQAASADESSQLYTPGSPADAHQPGDPQPTMADISFRKALHGARAASSHAESVLDGAPAERRTYPPASPEASGLRRDVSSLHSRALLLELELAESQRSCEEAAARHEAELRALRHAHAHDLARLRADAEAVLAAANADAPAMLAASAALTTQQQQLAATERLVAAAQLEARQAHAEAAESAAAAEELRAEVAQLRADEGRTRARQDAVLFEARLAVERAEAELSGMQLAVENERRAGEEARAHAESLESSYGGAAEVVDAARQRLAERDAALAEAAQEQQQLQAQLQAALLAAQTAETERDIVAARLDALKSALGTGSALAAARADAGSEACSDLAVVAATPAQPSHAAATPPESLPLAFSLLVQHAAVAEAALRTVQQAQRGAASNLGRRVVDAATAVQAAADAAGAVHSLQATLRALAQEPAAAAALSSGDVVLSRFAGEPAGESELAAARARCTHLEEREDVLQRQLAAAQAARDAAAMQAAKLEGESSRRLAAEADAASLRQTHDAIVVERAQLQASLTAATAALSASEAALRTASSQRDAAAADLAALRDAATAEAAEHTRLAASLQTSLDSIKTLAVAEIEALHGRVLRLKAKVAESRRREQDTLVALQEERRARESDAAAMRARGDSVAASTSEQLGAALARVAELEAALDAFAVAAATRNATASEQQAAADVHAAQVAELHAALAKAEEESLASSFALVVRCTRPACCDFARDVWPLPLQEKCNSYRTLLQEAQAEREEEAARAQAAIDDAVAELEELRAETAAVLQHVRLVEDAANERCASIEEIVLFERHRADEAERLLKAATAAHEQSAQQAAAAAEASRGAPVDAAALRAALAGVEVALDAQRRELERKDAELKTLRARAVAERRTAALPPAVPTPGEAALAAARAAGTLDAAKARMRSMKAEAKAAAELAAAELQAERQRTKAAEDRAAEIPALEEALRMANARLARLATQQRNATSQLEHLRAGPADGHATTADAAGMKARLAAAEEERDRLATDRDRLRRAVTDLRAFATQKDAAAAEAHSQLEAAHTVALRRLQAQLTAAERKARAAQQEVKEKEAALSELSAKNASTAAASAAAVAARNAAEQAQQALRAQLVERDAVAAELRAAVDAAARDTLAARAEATLRTEAAGALLAAVRALANRLISVSGAALQSANPAWQSEEGIARLDKARAMLRTYCAALDASLGDGAAGSAQPWRGDQLDLLIGLVAALANDAQTALEAAAAGGRG